MDKTIKIGKRGELIYDSTYDILLLKVANKPYKVSFEVENFVIDIAADDQINGLRIFDATQVYNVDKSVFEQITTIQFNAVVQNDTITIDFTFTSKDNKTYYQQIIKHLSRSYLPDSVISHPLVV